MKNDRLKLKFKKYTINQETGEHLITVQLRHNKNQIYLERWFCYPEQQKQTSNLTNFVTLYKLNWGYDLTEEKEVIREFLGVEDINEN